MTYIPFYPDCYLDCPDWEKRKEATRSQLFRAAGEK
jgi:hypothetical protein